ncbi:MAG: VIT family protein [Sphingomonadales bacterium]|nr:VIT family protein [Sphingomonadales bacterium]MDE2169758.1 VIT family protein [Sphingomonadales bacterium]
MSGTPLLPQTDPTPSPLRPEGHFITRTSWLRAAVLGANDGLLSTGSLMSGVAAASVSPSQLVLTGVAGLVAGAMSMAAGEYVSVSSQADTERADEEREKRELQEHPKQELAELAGIYRQRGLASDLAREVAQALMAKDALGTHMRDELGVTETSEARPVQAGLASALSFISGGLAPLAVSLVMPGRFVLPGIILVTVVMLAVLGALGARGGGAPVVRSVLRVVIFGSLAMAVTALVGHFFHGAV